MCAKLSDADMAAASNAVEAVLQHLERGDMEKFLQGWVEEPIVMPPDMPAVKGLAQLEAFIRTNWSGKRTFMSDVHVDGRDDLAVLTAHMTYFGAGPDGGDLEGKHMHTLLRQPDGKWLIATGIFNFDVPVTP